MAETVTMAQALSNRTEKQPNSEADQLRCLLQQIATQPTPSAKTINPAVPGELDSICRRACSLSAELIDKETRYTMVFCQDRTDVGVYRVLLDNLLADHMPLSRELGLKGFQQRNYIEILDGNSELMIAGLYRHDPSQFDQASVAALLEGVDDQDLLRLVDLVPISLRRGPRGLTGIWIDNSTARGVVVANSDRGDCIEAWKSLANNGFLPIEVSIADTSSHSRQKPFSIWHRSTRNASSLANYAMALCRLGDDDLIVKSLMRAPDPTLRTLLIHRFQTDGVDPARLVNWLQVSADPGIRAAIIQALGHYSEVDFEATKFNRAIELIRDAHLEDSDAGVHSSAQWALTQWHVEPDSISTDSAPSEFKNWYVDASGQTMSVVRGPTTFDMGSRIRPRMSSAPENQHLRTIDRDFAIGTHEVTWEQYAEFMPELPPGFTRHYSKLENGRHNPHAPQYQVSWYRAAEYCNWLSQRAGLPKSEWCYLPAEDGRYGPGMQVAVNPSGLLRSSMRSFNKPSNEQFTIGFRVARTLSDSD